MTDTPRNWLERWTNKGGRLTSACSGLKSLSKQDHLLPCMIFCFDAPSWHHAPELMEMALTETTFCSTHEACELLGLDEEDVLAKVMSGVIESWESVDGRRLILRQSVLALKGMSGSSGPVERMSQEQLRVCVVESNSALRAKYEDHLRRFIPSVSLGLFESTFDALLWIGANSPDFLILDIDMPTIDSAQLLQALRRNPALAGLKVMMGTSANLASVKGKLGSRAGVELVSKPIDIGDLEAFISADTISP